jgi:hypothetical protein
MLKSKFSSQKEKKSLQGIDGGQIEEGCEKEREREREREREEIHWLSSTYSP